MPKITVLPSQSTFQVPEGTNLLKALLQESFFVDNPCNGRGTCGKCKIRILPSASTDKAEPAQGAPVFSCEQAGGAHHLTSEEWEQGIRLACCVTVQTDLTVELLQKDKKVDVLDQGLLPDFAKDQFLDGYGIAVDIGTTTVALSLVELKSGSVLASASCVNPQKAYGLDVLTRITYEVEEGEKAIHQLQDSIVQGLNQLIHSVLDKAGVPSESVREMVVAANTTMLHLLMGEDARPMGTYPYRPNFLHIQERKASSIGLELPTAQLITLPNVSAFIGSDIVAGAAVCRLNQREGVTLFMDIGTNGEIVLATEGRLFCCSCAAGPALEGMNIRSGMRAAEGAIEAIQIQKEGLTYQVIGEAPAEGLCGSGILSVVKELIRNGLVKSNGAFVKKEEIPATDSRFSLIELDGIKRYLVIADTPQKSIQVTQGDIRQVQLAKGALLSGVSALVQEAGLTFEDLDTVLIAGQFGAHLPVESIVGTGILPQCVENKIEYVGNTSQTGALMALLSKEEREKMETIAKSMTYLELADTEDYEKRFRECLIFPEWQDFADGRPLNETL